jgi:chemotaxis protein methyltransferase CheR
MPLALISEQTNGVRSVRPSLQADLIETDRIDQEFPFGQNEFEFIAALAYARSGIVLGPSKKNMVYSRLTRRLRELKLPGFSSYCEFLSSPDGGKEMVHLVNAITTNLTRFMREQHHFEHLGGVALPKYIAEGKQRLRVWSAGCSSGEEAFSIAMTINETWSATSDVDARILASDLDTSMLARGQSGIYSDAALEAIPKGRRIRHFHRVHADRRDLWQANESLRSMITFRQLNLHGPWPMTGPFDVIFCRNVMIYFDGPAKAVLIGRFANMLAPGGWLYVGHSETLLTHQDLFHPCGRTIYRRNEQA